jgi:hypothetical protein
MKKAIIALLLVCVYSSTALAIDFEIFDTRNKIFQESKEIKSLVSSSKDPLLLIVMFDSCIQATTQLDAYFYMLSLFNAIKKADITVVHTDILNSWLMGIKQTNNLSISSIDNLTQPKDVKALFHVKMVRKLLSNLNAQVDAELSKVSIISKATKIKKK